MAPRTAEPNLTSRAILVAGGRGVGKLGQLLAVLVFVRLLAPEQWQNLALLLTIYLAALGIGGLNLQQGIYYFYGRLPMPERRALVGQTVAMMTVTALLSAIVIVGLAPWLDDSPFRVGALLPWLALAVLLEVPTQCTGEVLLATERATASALFTGSMAILQVAALVVPVVLGHELETVMQALVAYALLRMLCSLAIMHKVLPRGRLRFDMTRIKEQLTYTMPLALSIGSTAINQSIDKWYVAAFDAQNFGVYSVAAQEIPLVPVLPYAVGAVLATRMVHAYKTDNRSRVLEYWLASTGRMSLLVVPLSLGFILCAPEIVALLFTERYLAATLPFQIYTVILLHRVGEYGIMLRASGDTRQLWLASLLLLASNALLSLPLTLAFGMTGAAAGTLLANLIAWLFILTRIARVVDTKFSGVLPWGLYGRTLSIAVVSALACFLLTRSLEAGSLLTLGAKLGTFCILHYALTKLFRVGRALPAIPVDDDSFRAELSGQASPEGS